MKAITKQTFAFPDNILMVDVKHPDFLFEVGMEREMVGVFSISF